MQNQASDHGGQQRGLADAREVGGTTLPLLSFTERGRASSLLYLSRTREVAWWAGMVVVKYIGDVGSVAVMGDGWVAGREGGR
jgi:hypothetical protein